MVGSTLHVEGSACGVTRRMTSLRCGNFAARKVYEFVVVAAPGRGYGLNGQGC